MEKTCEEILMCAGTIVLVLLGIALLWAVFKLMRLLNNICEMGRKSIIEISQDTCQHTDRRFDDGHPELPFVCNDCKKRLP